MLPRGRSVQTGINKPRGLGRSIGQAFVWGTWLGRPGFISKLQELLVAHVLAQQHDLGVGLEEVSGGLVRPTVAAASLFLCRDGVALRLGTWARACCGG